MHAVGLRYRLHSKHLPGRPDLAFPARRAVLFVHSCFWHRHPGCRHVTTPATRRDYWLPKLARNVERDRSNAANLLAAGWTVLTVWECETRQPGVLSQLVEQVRAIMPGKRLRLPSAVRLWGSKGRQRPRVAPAHDTSGKMPQTPRPPAPRCSRMPA